ncbi:MAG TPA: MmcQ/YjbR family DNA-binding protein [Solirubrobacteraceae bacterium]|nr:MmcQ/YjbR family DNA-binding protein [Solirubrobacteraceae bacterium]
MDLRELCLSFTGAEETYPFSAETTVFKVRGKIFAIAALDREPPSISLKCEPEIAAQLRAGHEAITPGYHLNKRHWNTVRVDGSLPEQLVRDMVEDSYDLVVESMPKRIRDDLGWP